MIKRQPPKVFKSEAQREKFLELLNEGKISFAEYKLWEQNTGNVPLPNHTPDPVRVRPHKRRVGY